MSRLQVAAMVLLGACAAPRAAQGPGPADAGVPRRAEAPRLPGEEVLERQPAIASLGTFAAPVPSQATLPSGLQVLVVERPGASIEALTLVVRRGSAGDPPGKAGLASMAAAMLETGAAGRSQEELAALAASLGAELRVEAKVDGLTLAVSAPPSRLEPMARLLADLALRPTFDAREWKKAHARRLAELEEQLADPRTAAANAHAAALYGEGPLGHAPAGSPATVRGLALEDVKRLWNGVAPQDVALVAVGPAPRAEVVALATRLLGSWRARGPRPAPAPEAAPVGPRPRLVLVEFPGRPQTVLQVGQPGVPLASPDVPALRVLNTILGGSFTSRLNANLREQHGYTYGAGSTFAFGRGPGPFRAVTSVKSEVTGQALKEVLAELRRAVAEPLDEAELAKGKALLTFGLVEQLERSESTAALVAELFTAGAPLEALAQLAARLQALTSAEVQAAAQRALDPATMTITAAGDPGVLAQFEAAGLGLPAPQRRTPAGALVPTAPGR